MLEGLSKLSPVTLGILGSFAAGSLTGIGAMPVLFGRLPSPRSRDVLLGFAAGVARPWTWRSMPRASASRWDCSGWS